VIPPPVAVITIVAEPLLLAVAAVVVVEVQMLDELSTNTLLIAVPEVAVPLLLRTHTLRTVLEVMALVAVNPPEPELDSVTLPIGHSHNAPELMPQLVAVAVVAVVDREQVVDSNIAPFGSIGS